MQDRTFQSLFRGIGIAIACVVALWSGYYIYLCYETAWGEFGMFFLPIVVGVPFVTLESITFSVKFFIRRSTENRVFSILKGIELALSVTALLFAALSFVDGLGAFMLVTLLFTVAVSLLWIAELIVKRHI